MKAKVIETGEIIDVKLLYSVIYSQLDCNGKIIAEYDEDELEFINNKKEIDLKEEFRKWLNNSNVNNQSLYNAFEYGYNLGLKK